MSKLLEVEGKIIESALKEGRDYYESAEILAEILFESHDLGKVEACEGKLFYAVLRNIEDSDSLSFIIPIDVIVTEDYSSKSGDVDSLNEEYYEELLLQREAEDAISKHGDVTSYSRGYCDLRSRRGWSGRNEALRRWSHRVRRRDGHKCRRLSCGSKSNLHAHHILNKADNPDLAFEDWNGITLCSVCHREFHSEYGNYYNNEDQIKEFIA